MGRKRSQVLRIANSEVPQDPAEYRRPPDLDPPPPPQRGERRWSAYDQAVYDRLYRIEVPGSTLAHLETLEALCLQNELHDLYQRMGLGDLYLLDERSYPNYTKQFLASAQLTYADHDDPDPETGVLSFLVGEVYYAITLPELCDIFGLSSGPDLSFAWTTEIISTLTLISSATQTGRTAKESLIRHPVLRYAARLIGANIYGSTAAAAVSKLTLCHLYLGIREFLPRRERDYMRPTEQYNFGAVIASELCSYRSMTTWHNTAHRCGFGAIITRIFKHCRVRLTGAEIARNTRNEVHTDYMDFTKLAHMHFLCGPATRMNTAEGHFWYIFQMERGVESYTILPDDDVTRITSKESLSFLHAPLTGPAPWYISKRATAPLPEDALVDNDALDEDAVSGFVLPFDSSEFNLPDPLGPSATTASRLRRLEEIGKRNNAMLHQMWRAIASMGRWCRPPASAAAAPQPQPPPAATSSSSDEPLRRPRKRRTREDGASSSRPRD